MEEAVQWNVPVEVVRETILYGITTFVVEGSFFPEKSHLVAAHWRCSSNEILLATGNFLSSVELQHRNAYTAELVGCLALIKFISWIVGDSPPFNQILVNTVMNCAAVTNMISSVPPVTPFFTYFHQIVREIRMLVKKLNVKLVPVKIRAHLDDQLEWEELSFLEKLKMCSTTKRQRNS